MRPSLVTRGGRTVTRDVRTVRARSIADARSSFESAATPSIGWFSYTNEWTSPQPRPYPLSGNVDFASERGAVGDREARRVDVAGNTACDLDLDLLARGDVAGDRALYDHRLGVD